MLNRITPVILTFNEEANLERTLSGLQWARRIVIVDSKSSDDTRRIAECDPRVSLYERPFDQHARQWNFAIEETEIQTDWILALDADYFITPELTGELDKLNLDGETDAYQAGFVYCVFGRSLRGSLYPPVTVLFRRGTARYVQVGHTQRLKIDREAGRLENRIRHDDRKSLSRWFMSQQRYVSLEAEHLLATPPGERRFADRIRVMAWPAPALVFLYALFVKGCVFDGWAGWYYALQRVLVEIMIALEIIDRRLRKSAIDPPK